MTQPGSETRGTSAAMLAAAGITVTEEGKARAREAAGGAGAVDAGAGREAAGAAGPAFPRRVSGPAVRVVLEASAIIAFTRESIHVGEVIAEVADEENAAAALPVLCLAEATRAVADIDRLDLLVNHPATVILTPDADSWRALAVTYETVGRLDAASAVLAAIDLDCDVLTGQPGLYGGLAGGGPIIPI